MRPGGSRMGGPNPGMGFGQAPPFLRPPPTMMAQQQQQQQQQLLMMQQQAMPRFQNQRMLQQQAAIRELQQKTLLKQQQQQQQVQPSPSLLHPSAMGMLSNPADLTRQAPSPIVNNFGLTSFNNYSGVPVQQPPGFSKPVVDSAFPSAPSSQMMTLPPMFNRNANPMLATNSVSSGQAMSYNRSDGTGHQNIPVLISRGDSRNSDTKDTFSQNTNPRIGAGDDSYTASRSSQHRPRERKTDEGWKYQASGSRDGYGSSRDKTKSQDDRRGEDGCRRRRDYDDDRYRRDRSHSSRSSSSRSEQRFDSESRSSISTASDKSGQSDRGGQRYGERGDRRSGDSKNGRSRRDSSREFERSSRIDRYDRQDKKPRRCSRDRSVSSDNSSQKNSPLKRKRESSSKSRQYPRESSRNSSDKLPSMDLEYYGDSPSKRKFERPTGNDTELDIREDTEEGEPIVYTIRSCPADLYFVKNSSNATTEASKRMVELENKFEEEILNRANNIRNLQDKVEEPPPTAPVHHHHHHKCSGSQSSSSSCDDSSDDDNDDDDEDGGCNHIVEEWTRRKKNPYNLHPELWYNEQGQVNDGPLCRCSIKSRKTGIRHDIYPGEKAIPLCDMEGNNSDKLFHYRVTMSPYTNFLTKTPTLIEYDNHEYIFEGFSLFTHDKLENVPACKLLRFNIEYTIHLIPETAPENFTVRSLNLFNKFLFNEILELVDLDWGTKDGGCNRFHFMPRFSRTLPDSGCKEVLSMNTVLNFLIKSSKPLMEDSQLKGMEQSSEDMWRNLVDTVRGMIVTKPGMRPSSIRIDQLDRNPVDTTSTSDGPDDKSDRVARDKAKSKSPLIIHQGCRPAQLSYAGDPLYRKAWKQYVKYRHLLNSKPKILASDKQRLKEQEEKLQEICLKKTMKREVTIELQSPGFLCTGLRADLCQHALMIPVLMSHLRFHICLDVLEEEINYKFKDRSLLQLALTHTSYRTNYGTNPDHTRNSLTNCGMRQVEYGDRRIHYQNTRKRGICILLDIMSRFGKQEETLSEIPHNERLEFLGDAVIEFLTSVHLFYMFPWLEEGGLSTYRMALVQNQHLAQLAKKLKLQDFMLYVHGPDLCHESDLRHAMANCCEALMGALFMDGGLEVVDAIFSRTLFDDDAVLLNTWNDLPRHILQQEEPGGDRHWVKSSPILQKLEKFEESIGVKFSHIRLLAKAFTHRNIGDNPLTHGHNQRLEFLGDTVLQLVASEYLYRHYPEHHEGHLSLLRSSLVNSRTQGLVYDDLGMSEYVIFNEDALSDGLDMKTKQRADMLESFLGALYVDKGLDFCWAFCNVCFFPRLKDFIVNQDWNDPKSQLQQCCLTLREVGGGEPDIPIYKVIESIGPTNTRKYVVAVYFRGTRLATGNGHSIQQAEMSAATNALKKREELFPILQHQRRFLEKFKLGLLGKDDAAMKSSHRKSSVSLRKRRRYNPREKKN